MLLIVGFNYDVSITFWDKLGNRTRILCYSFSNKLQSIDNPECHTVIWALLALTGIEYFINYSLPVYSLKSVLITSSQTSFFC